MSTPTHGRTRPSYRRRALALAALVVATAATTTPSPVPATAATTVPPPISVATFGALPGDTLDDTAPILSALRAAAQPDAASRVVKVPAGVYSVYPDKLTVPAGVTVSGIGATLSARGYGFSLLGMAGSTTTLTGVNLDGRDKVVRGLTVAAGSRTVRITGLRVTNIASPTDPAVAGYAENVDEVVAGIKVEGDTEDVVIDRVTVDRVRAAVPPDPSLEAVGNLDTTTPYRGWNREHTSVDGGWAPHAAQLVTSPVRAGQYAVRQELRRTDAPVNSGMRSEFNRAPEGAAEEHWYGFSVFLPKSGSEAWATDPSPEIVAQWHSTPDSDAEHVSPPLALQTRAGRWELVRQWDANAFSTNTSVQAAGQVERVDLGSYSADRGVWVEWAFHVRWGWRADQEPVTEVWKNRKPVYSKAGPNTYNDAVGNYFKWGIYKWEWGMERPSVVSTTKSRVVYHDEFRQAGPDGSLQAVSPPAMPVRAPGLTHVPVARGIWLVAGVGQVVPRNVTVRSSTISNVGPKDDGDGLVIQGHDAADGPDAALLVTGTTFNAVAKRAVKIQAPGVALANNRVTNPWLGDNPYYVRDSAADTTDMYSYVSVYAPRVTVTGTTVTGSGSAYAGIEVDHGATSGIRIIGNKLANGTASRIGPSSLVRLDVPVDGLVLQKNTLTNGTWGFRCADPVTADSVVSGNTTTKVVTPWSGCIAPPVVEDEPDVVPATGGAKVRLSGWDFGATSTAFSALQVTAKVNGAAAPVRWIDTGAVEVTLPASPPGPATVVLARGGATASPVVLDGRYVAALSKASTTSSRLTGGGLLTLTGRGLHGSTGWTLVGATEEVPLPSAGSKTALTGPGVFVLDDTTAYVKVPPAPDTDGDGTPDAGTYRYAFTPRGGETAHVPAALALVYR